jgi:hypothetical protein
MCRIRLVAATMIFTAGLPACGLYHVVSDFAAGAQADPQSVRQVRVTVWTGERFELSRVEFAEEFMRGTTAEGDTVTVAMADVELMEVRRDDPEGKMVLAACAAAEMMTGTERNGWSPLIKASRETCVTDGITFTYY